MAAVSVASFSLTPENSYSQRTTENVATASIDGFGRSVGTEKIGLYTSTSVRGFSAVDAGNVRIEGLYFDQQIVLTPHLLNGTTMKVGIAAQGNALPSPTGLAEYTLRRSGDKTVVSTQIEIGPRGGETYKVDSSLVLMPNKFDIAMGGGLLRSGTEWGTTPISYKFAALPRWRPTPNVEIIPFFDYNLYHSAEARPMVFANDATLPPRIDRHHYFGQGWAAEKGYTNAYGVLGSYENENWLAKVGLFRSIWDRDETYSELFFMSGAGSAASEVVVASPSSRFDSISGEMRVSRLLKEGTRTHAVTAILRGRSRERDFGGEELITVGTRPLGTQQPVPKPTLNFGEKSSDEVNHWTAGMSYTLDWEERGELTAGLVTAEYKKMGAIRGGTPTFSSSNPLFWTISASVNLAPNTAIFGSRTAGLEESPTAPDNATNRGEMPPAARTEQVDFGVRTRWLDITAILGAFRVSKPYFGLDDGKIFRDLGTMTNQGLEASLIGSPIENLQIVSGAVLFDSTVTGPAIATSSTLRPLGSRSYQASLTFDYRFPDIGASIDATMDMLGPQVGNSTNTLKVPASTLLAVGARYRFDLGGFPTNLRVLVQNVAGSYGLNVSGSGAFTTDTPRSVTVTLTTDF